MEHMIQQPLVSVLMTAYNRQAYIEAAIRSVLASTYSHLELIVVDDGSTDNTVEIAARIAEEDARVQVHHNERNLGDYRNRNRAAALARGEYLKYVDSDDILYPYGLEAMVGMMAAFPSAALGMSDLAPRPDTPFPVQLEPREAYREHFFGRRLFGHGPLAAILRTDAFRQAGGFRGYHVAGDLELWLRLGARFPVVMMPPGFTWWRRHEEQEFVRDDAAEVYPRLVYRVHAEALSSPDCPLSPEERAEALTRVRRTRVIAIFGLLRRGRFRTAYHLYRERHGDDASSSSEGPPPAESLTP